MARKKGGKSKGFVSKGERPNVKSDTKRLMRNEVTLLETTLNTVSYTHLTLPTTPYV